MARVAYGPKPVSFISGDDRKDWITTASKTLDLVAMPCVFLPVIGRPIGLASSLLRAVREPTTANLIWLSVDVGTAFLAPALHVAGHPRHARAVHAAVLGASSHPPRSK